MMRKVIGWSLVALPFVAVLGVAAYGNGWRAPAVAAGITAAMFLCIDQGIKLLTKP